MRTGEKNEFRQEEFKIRSVGEKQDLRQVAQLADVIWKEHYTPIIGKKQVDYMLENFQSVSAMEQQMSEGMEYFLVESKDDPVGYLAFRQQGEELFLSKIYLLDSHRGKGLGRLGMRFVESEVGDRGLSFITLTVNKNNSGSIKAYESMGFVNEGPLETDIGGGFVMDDFLMRKKISKDQNRL